MAQNKDARRGPVSIPSRPANAGELTGIDLTAAALSVIWLIVSGAFFLFSGNDGADGVRFLLTLMVVFFPVGMIWVAALAARSNWRRTGRTMRPIHQGTGNREPVFRGSSA